MLTEDTDLSHVPWQLLIRARTVDEVDAVISSVELGRLAEVASVEAVRTLADAAGRARGAAPEPATAEQKLSVLSAVADFDDWYCGSVPRRPWPHRGDVLDSVSDPVTAQVARGARELVGAGSQALQKTVGEALEQF
jgi:hypothetical protein